MDFIVYFSMYFKQYIKNTTKLINRRKHRVEMTLIMGSQLRWLERTPDKREVDGSIPFEPTNQIINNNINKSNSTLKNIQMK